MFHPLRAKIGLQLGSGPSTGECSAVPEPKKVKVPFGSKGLVDATEIPVEEANERWTEITLQDGAKMRVKSNVVSAVRIDNEWDDQGNPIYVLNLAPMMITEVPESLKRKKS